ncbi:MAG: hypothetical protein AABW51_03235 [Nanoarchaeota archaeon]
MNKNIKPVIVFITLYLIFGILYQIYTCSFEKPSDISCSGITWTPLVILSWPLFGLFDLIYGFIIRGLITTIAFILIIAISYLVFRRKSKI